MKILILILFIHSFSFSNESVIDQDFTNHMELFVHEDIINQF